MEIIVAFSKFATRLQSNRAYYDSYNTSALSTVDIQRKSILVSMSHKIASPSAEQDSLVDKKSDCPRAFTHVS